MRNGARISKRIRLVVIHEDRLCREGIRQICSRQKDIEIAGDYSQPKDALASALAAHPDVVVMSMGWQWMDAIDFVRSIHEQQPDIRVILITRTLHDPLMGYLRTAGVAACLTKDAQPQALLSAIRAAQRDEPHPANALDIQPVSFNTPLAQDLTPAEALVLSLVAHGANNRTIARQLKLSEQTVANRLQVVYEKLGVNNRIQATLLALRHGWVSLDE